VVEEEAASWLVGRSPVLVLLAEGHPPPQGPSTNAAYVALTSRLDRPGHRPGRLRPSLARLGTLDPARRVRWRHLARLLSRPAAHRPLPLWVVLHGGPRVGRSGERAHGSRRRQPQAEDGRLWRPSSGRRRLCRRRLIR